MNDVIDPATRMNDVIDPATRVLRDVFGYTSFRGEQGEVVGTLSVGVTRSCSCRLRGKSLCYQIPALVRDGVGVVISPLIALMQDQVAALREAGVRAEFLNSSLEWHQQQEIEKRVRAGEVELLYVAPERLVNDRCLALLDDVKIAVFAIDEAHCVSQWGHDFRPEYMRLSVLADRYAGVPRIALTATADETTRKEILARLKLNDARVFIASFDRPNIRYRVAERDNPRKQLLQFIQEEHAALPASCTASPRSPWTRSRSFLSTRASTRSRITPDKEHETRGEHLSRFVRDDAVVMVATVAFRHGDQQAGRAIRRAPRSAKSIEAYYQETGRAGRDGLPADAWMI